MNVRVLLVSCLLAFSALVLADPVRLSPACEDLPYRGRFQDDPRFHAVIDALPTARARAMVQIHERLGIDVEHPAAIVIRIQDALDLSQRFLFPAPSVRMLTAAESATERQRVVITIYAEFVVAGGTDLIRDLTHELTHAVMRQRMGENYEALPAWIREGIAQWTAQDGPDVVQFYLGHPAFLFQPETLIQGLGGVRGLSGYPEDWLAFDYMESLAGCTGVRSFVASLSAGKPWRASLHQAVNEDWQSFREHAKAYALAALSRLADPGLPGFRRVAALARASSGEDAPELAVAAAAAFLRDFPTSRHARGAMMLQAQALLRLDRSAPARRLLLTVAEPGAPWSGYEDEALRHLGIVDSAAADWDAAVQHFSRLVSEVPDSPHFAEGLYGWGLALAKSGRREAARAILVRALASFPSHPCADEARSLIR